MKYLGSKNRIAKHILPIMLDAAKEKGITTWVELFSGGGNMIDKVPFAFKKVGVDINPHTIAAMIGVRDYVDSLPTEVSEEYYRSLKGTEPNPITSWVRFECSFGAKFENGYARNAKGANYALMGVNLAKK
jgi:DNA adenine methylase